MAERVRRGMLVPAIALDDLDIRRRVAFLKIDTQGSDLRVMRGARRLIAAHRMPILFEHEAEYDSAFNTSFSEYAAFIAQVGYKLTETSSFQPVFRGSGGRAGLSPFASGVRAQF